MLSKACRRPRRAITFLTIFSGMPLGCGMTDPGLVTLLGKWLMKVVAQSVRRDDEEHLVLLTISLVHAPIRHGCSV
jgi:hypothetical protein